MSRFAALDDDSKVAKKKSAKASKHGDADDDGKKSKHAKEKKARGDAGDKDEKRAERHERKKTDIEAFLVIIVVRLTHSFERYSQQDCDEAAAWLGINSADVAHANLGKLWPRMLKHMAAAIEGGAVCVTQLSELWELGPRLFAEGAVCEETRRLQVALESRFESDAGLREEVQAREALRKRLMPPLPTSLEAELADQPLALFGRPPALRAERKPEPVLFDKSRRSFAFRWPGLLKGESRFLRELREGTPWCELLRPDGSIKRSTCWYTRGGCRCDYTYGSDVRVHAVEDAARFLRLMEELTEQTFRAARPDWSQEQWPNSANLNLYTDGSQAVGWHADDESLFSGKEEDCLIVSLSLGATREFWLAPRSSSAGETAHPDESAITWMGLEDGDLLSMEGLCQKHYLHCVPTGTRFIGPRVNVTWRWVKEHKRHCPLSHADSQKRS